VDLNCHLREPGNEARETIQSATLAAAAGGYTTICAMPNTQPPLDSPALIDFLLDRAASPDTGGVFVQPIGALTKGLNGREPASYASLKRAGVAAVSDEGSPTQNAALLQRAMEHCLQLDLPILIHADELSLSAGGSINEGGMSALLGLKGIPRSAEEVAIMRACVLALNTGCRIHILRVSTWGSVETIRQFKYLGAAVSCDVAPHHFCLTEEDMPEFDAHWKTTPPLRTMVDVELVQQGLSDGTIDCIASDHSPYADHEVEVPFEEAPFGFAGLESTLAVTLTHLTHRGILSPLETIRRLSTTPAEILRLEAGNLKPGTSPVAQVTVINPNLEWTFDVHRTFSKGKNTPFQGHRLMGKAVLTLVGTENYRDPGFEPERYRRS
jgi:dihydroorotase